MRTRRSKVREVVVVAAKVIELVRQVSVGVADSYRFSRDLMISEKTWKSHAPSAIDRKAWMTSLQAPESIAMHNLKKDSVE